MEMDRLKIELLQKIIDCNDADVLLRLKEFLAEINPQVKEEAGEYVPATSNPTKIPDSYYRKLEEDYEKFKKGELKASSWEEVRAKVIKKHGL